MKRLFPMLMIAVAIVVLPAIAMGDGGDKDKKGRRGHKRPSAKAMFERIDADKDGQITLEELPERMKERLGKSLAKADTNGDKQLSLDEFKALLKSRREAAKARRDKWAEGKKGSPGEKRAKGKKGGSGKKYAKGKKGRHMPDIKAVFAKLDTDNNKQLSLEEFTVGAKKLHARMRGHMRKMGPGMHKMDPGMHKMSPEAIKKIKEMRAKMKERFEKADKNGDGKLSREESPERLKKHFDEIDADKDGQLSREELRKAFRKHRAKNKDGKHHGGKKSKG